MIVEIAPRWISRKVPGGVIFFCQEVPMPPGEPAAKRCIAFIDGQNLFYAVKDAFGYSFPNYDPMLLAKAVCVAQGWDLAGVRFYTGIPDAGADPDRNAFWVKKLQVMGSRGIRTITRPLRYQNKVVSLRDGTMTSVPVGREKGIDVRLALDVVRFAIEDHFDVGLIFSQDQDLAEVVTDALAIAKRENRWIKLASAFPISPTYQNRRGINGTDWVKIDRALYEACIDPNDYRPKPGQQ